METEHSMAYIGCQKGTKRERAKLELNSSRTFSIFVVIVCNRFNFIKRHIQKDIFILMQYSEYRGISSEWVGGRRNIIFYCVADSIACACISMRIFEDKLNNGFLLTSFSTQRAWNSLLCHSLVWVYKWMRWKIFKTFWLDDRRMCENFVC